MADPTPIVDMLLARLARRRKDAGYRLGSFERIDADGPVPEDRPDLGRCWLWLQAKQPTGYGRVAFNKKKNLYAHRWVYEMLVGPIPEGLELDHLCRNRSCVNPRHLEPVTHAENSRRALASSVPTLPGNCYG